MDRLFALQEKSKERMGSCSSGFNLIGSAREPKMSHEKGGTTTFGSSAEVSGEECIAKRRREAS